MLNSEPTLGEERRHLPSLDAVALESIAWDLYQLFLQVAKQAAQKELGHEFHFLMDRLAIYVLRARQIAEGDTSEKDRTRWAALYNKQLGEIIAEASVVLKPWYNNLPVSLEEWQGLMHLPEAVAENAHRDEAAVAAEFGQVIYDTRNEEAIVSCRTSVGRILAKLKELDCHKKTLLDLAAEIAGSDEANSNAAVHLDEVVVGLMEWCGERDVGQFLHDHGGGMTVDEFDELLESIETGYRAANFSSQFRQVCRFILRTINDQRAALIVELGGERILA